MNLDNLHPADGFNAIGMLALLVNLALFSCENSLLSVITISCCGIAVIYNSMKLIRLLPARWFE